jgi:hypothetical protein
MFVSKLAVLYGFATVAFAAPAPSKTIEKRSSVGVYFCENQGWSGICDHAFLNVDTCSKFS